MLGRLIVAILVTAAAALPQHRVDPHNTYQRIICVVPMVGKGTYDDPRRPLYAPLPPTQAPAQARPAAAPRNAILAYSHQVSDDGKFALVEFIAADRAAFQQILNDKSITVFQKGKSTKSDIEKELKKYKKDFDLEKFGLVLP